MLLSFVDIIRDLLTWLWCSLRASRKGTPLNLLSRTWKSFPLVDDDNGLFSSTCKQIRVKELDKATKLVNQRQNSHMEEHGV